MVVLDPYSWVIGHSLFSYISWHLVFKHVSHKTMNNEQTDIMQTATLWQCTLERESYRILPSASSLHASTSSNCASQVIRPIATGGHAIAPAGGALNATHIALHQLQYYDDPDFQHFFKQNQITMLTVRH